MEDHCLRRMLSWRNLKIENVCPECDGSGKKVYGSTLTWRSGSGNFGGQMLTTDVCDLCWGSGDKNQPWLNLKRLYTDNEGV